MDVGLIADELDEETADSGYIGDMVEEIKQHLPDNEKIGINGLEIETDNRWLHRELDEFQKLEKDSPERISKIQSINERLGGIIAKIKELESAAADPARSKDAEKQKLTEILQRPEYQPVQNQDKSALERWVDSLMEWLDSLFPKPAKVDPLNVPSYSIPPGLVQTLVIIGAVGVLAFVAWRFLPYFQARRKKEKKDAGERIVLGERLAVHESADSLFAQAEKLAREGNFRAAIRRGYIALLCELGDRRVVRLAQHKTNRDYLFDVRERGELWQGMRTATGYFEQHWYGFTDAGEEDWARFREQYQQNMTKV